MKLTDQQKEDLKNLSIHPGYILLKKMEYDFIVEFNNDMMLSEDFNPEDEVTQKRMKEVSTYLKARKDIFRSVENSNLSIVGFNLE